MLTDGRLAGLWRVEARGKVTEVSLENLGRVARAELEPDAEPIAKLRGASEAALVLT